MTLVKGSKISSNNMHYLIEEVLGQGSFGVIYKAKGFTFVKGAFGDMEVALPNAVAIKEFYMKDINSRDDSGSVQGMSVGGMAYNYAQKFRK